jgi:hypothetical protein
VVEKVLQARAAKPIGTALAVEERSMIPLATVARPGFRVPKAVALAATVAMVIVGIDIWSRQQPSKPIQSIPQAIASSPSPAEAKPAQSVSEIIAEELNKPDGSAENPRLSPAHAAESGARARSNGPSHHPLTVASTGRQRDSADDPADSPTTGSEIAVNLIALANLEVVVEHAFPEGQALISVDNRPVYTEELRGDKKRRALLFHYTQGRQSQSIPLRPGKHTILVRVRSAGSNYDMSKSVTERIFSRQQPDPAREMRRAQGKA